MNRIMKLALSAVLGTMLVAPAFAQSSTPFPDTDRNHWAYQAVQNLKDRGCLVGYEDGFFRGARMMTRYEFAAATNACLQKVLAMFDGVNDQIKALEEMIKGASPDGIQDLRDQLAALKNEVNGMKGWGQAISDLQRLTKEFERELTDLGVKVDDILKTLDDHERRIKALEARKPAIDIHGDVNLIALMGHSSDNRFGILPDGTLVGIGDFNGSYAGLPVGATRDMHIGHNWAFDLKTTNETGPKAHAVIVLGNQLDLFGNYSTNYGGTFVDANSDMYIDKLAVTFDSSFVGQAFSAEIGRVSHSVGDYLWKRTDFSKHYLKDARRADGEYRFDGAKLGFHFGKASLLVFGGRNSAITSVNGVEINPMFLGNGTVDQTLGLQLQFPIGDMGGLNLAYMWQDSNTLTPFGAGAFNRQEVFGGEANFRFGNIDVYGSYAQTTLKENNSTTSNDDNVAYDIRLGYSTDNWGVKGGYRRVENNFSAYGDWGRIGTWWNPTNIEGFNAMVWFKPSAAFKIYGKGEFLSGVENFITSPIGRDDDVTSFKVGLDYNLSNGWMAGLSYEDTRFDYNVGTDPHIRFYTIDLGYNLSANSNIRVFYIYSDADYKGRFGLDPAGAGRYTGGLIGTQLSLKF